MTSEKRTVSGKVERIGKREVVDGTVFYKKTRSGDLMRGIQIGIRHSVRSLVPSAVPLLLLSRAACPPVRAAAATTAHATWAVL